MGKYTPPNNEDLNWSIEERNGLRIANELAEANRLKRLELKSEITGLSKEERNTIKELEDQA